MNLDFTKLDGLLPAVVQDDATNEVLMLAFINELAWQETVRTGLATFWSRSRNQLWRKGESSGHQLRVTQIFTDCDQDTIILKVQPTGPGVCHEGFRSCFFRRLEDGAWLTEGERAFDPDEVYA